MKYGTTTTTESKRRLKQISHIIVRLEVDDLNRTTRAQEAKLLNRFNENHLNPKLSHQAIHFSEEETRETCKDTFISNTSNLNIYETLKFDKKLQKTTDNSIENSPPIVTSKEKELFTVEELQRYIGNRESRLFSIETFYFNNYKEPELMQEEDPTQSNKQLVDNAMTMQKALETAYNDWNKPKSPETNAGEENVEALSKQVEKLTTESTMKSELIDETVLENESNRTTTTTEIAYMFGNPHVDLVKGFIHIYKDCNLSVFDEKHIEAPAEVEDDIKLSTENRSEMLCMIGVPNSVSCNELLDFVMPFNEHLQFMRICRDSYPNQYMVLFKFINQKDADLFYSHNNNKPFNSIEDNLCHLAFVERVETINSSKGAAKPIPGFIELPACYICLERMDESLDGVISILCNHSFHTSCLVKWGDTCCPVCRYSQTPEYTDIENACTECGNSENLWICLICGYIGCGRYAGGHAHTHFKETQHTYCMELGNNKVWDYAADNYVHRLIQNKADGKLVSVDEASREVNPTEKVDSITLEYTYLLTMQLDSQRLFFEERLNKMEEKANFQLEETELKLMDYMDDNLKLKTNLQQITKEKMNLDKKYATLTTKFNKLQSELNEEKELNKCLASNQEIYQSKLVTLEDKLKKSDQEKAAEIEDLQSQLRDVMFYLDAQSKLSKSVDSEEIQGSSMQIQQDEQTPSTSTTASNLSNSAKMANRRKRK